MLNQKFTIMSYTLHKKETGNKVAKYHYKVLDEKGNVISERKSNREYVACTINGQYYFGRIHLIGKGNHGWQIKWNAEEKKEDVPIAYLALNNKG